MDDDDILHDMGDWWMEDKHADKHFLAVLVHRDNPDIIDDPTTIPEGATRQAIRKEERAAAKRADKFVGANEAVAKMAAADRKETDRLMAIKEMGMQISCDQMQCNLITSQLTVVEKYDQLLKTTWSERGGDGDARYRNTMTDLIEELPLIKKQKREAEEARKKASETTTRSTMSDCSYEDLGTEDDD